MNIIPNRDIAGHTVLRALVGVSLSQNEAKMLDMQGNCAVYGSILTSE